MYSKIMVAVDGSENSMRAVEQAAMLAEASGPECQVRLLSVIAIDVYSDMVYDPLEAHGDAQLEKIRPAIELCAKRGVHAEAFLLHGRPAEEIVRVAEDGRADLLVIGSRGLNALQELAIGSVSHKVIKHATCPVLVVK